jgi:hypothetical protein
MDSGDSANTALNVVVTYAGQSNINDANNIYTYSSTGM